MDLTDLQKSSFEVIDKRINLDFQRNFLKELWGVLCSNVFPFTNGPYPVNHGAVHITQVISNIDTILKATVLERLYYNVNDLTCNLHILFSAALIHDINMRYTTIDSHDSIVLNRNTHADFDKIKKELGSILSTHFNYDTELICLLAASHANSIDKNGKKESTADKINLLNRKFSLKYPYIEYFARVLQFADLLDIGPKRLNPFDQNAFPSSQAKHYYKHRHFELIKHDKEFLLTREANFNDSFNITKELCDELNNQFNYFKNYMHFGWKLTLPDIPEDRCETELIIPPERRIRIQTSHNCYLRCNNCHFDEYNRGNTPSYENVLKIIKNLKKEKKKSTVFPQANVSFTLTGGEPFTNRPYISKFIEETYSNDEKENTTYLLTNASQTKVEEIQGDILILNSNKLNKLRISLNYNSNGVIEQKSTRIGNIKLYANTLINPEIRINHVLREGVESEIVDFVRIILESFKSEIPGKIQEIGFIQDTINCSYNIFKLAKTYCETHCLTLETDQNERKRTTILNGLKISFIKLNCDNNDDFVERCFKCVQEQDIKITSDARILTCNGWDENYKPKLQSIQININAPLTGIAGIIRKKYGIAGFYGHFPSIVELLNGIKKHNGFSKSDYKDTTLQSLLGRIGVNVNNYTLESAAFQIIKLILDENAPIKQLYLEGSYSEQILLNSTELSINILKAIFNMLNVGDISKVNKHLLNSLLLVISYLTVDENLFSTGRTIIVRGLTKNILSKYLSNEDYRNSEYLTESTYCIATIALENINPQTIHKYITSILSENERDKSGLVQYIEGCIYRQLNDNQQAIDAFSKAFNLSNYYANNSSDELAELLKEIRAESQRSLGAILKKDAKKKREAASHFMISQYYSTKDNTKLRYSSLFSDGYSLLLKFFSNDFDKNILESTSGYQAYILLSDSIHFNPHFYASQIRIALLDLAFGDIEKALLHSGNGLNVFCNKGMLTDQEYLNKILCDFINLYSVFEYNHGILNINDYLPIMGLNITGCTNIGYRDIECIIEDMNILYKIILKRNIGRENDRTEFINRITAFNKECSKLLPPKYHKNDHNDNFEINEFHHVCIQTNDYRASHDFYTSILNCEEIKENKDFHGRAFNTWLQAGNVRIELQTPKNDKSFNSWSSVNAGPVHVCLVVDDVEKAYSAIKTRYSQFKIKDGQELYSVKDKNIKIFKLIAPEGTEIEIRDTANID